MVKLYQPFEGRREFTGILTGFDDAGFTIQTEDNIEMRFTKKETSTVHLVEDWDEDKYGGETENE